MKKGISMTISFCIPVYNVKDYLKPCIESIYAQKITDFEIICIDDCSTDGSYELLLNLSDIYSELVVKKNKTNMGISCSRNLALKMSRGKYVWFVDADDMLVPDTAGLYLSIAEKESANAVLGSFTSFNDGSLPEYKNGTDAYHRVSFSDMDDFYPKRSTGYPCFGVWLGIFDKSFLLTNNVLFRENLSVYEDYTFYFEFGMASERVIRVDHYGYYYRVRENSASHLARNIMMRRGFECSKQVLAVYEGYRDRCTPELQDTYDLQVFLMKRLSIRCLSRIDDNNYVKEGLQYLKKEGMYPFEYDDRADFSEKLNWKVKMFRRLLTKERSFWIARAVNLIQLRRS